MTRLLPTVLLLTLLLTACADATSGSGAGDTGTIHGTVLLGPQCPVETASSPCPDAPLAGVEVKAVGAGGAVAATAVSDASGGFSMTVPAGDLTLEAVVDDPARSAKPVRVTVEAGKTVEIDVPVDSGIR